MTSTELFFGLLKYFCGTQADLPSVASREEWDPVYELATKQALLGCVFHVMEQYPKDLYPEKKKVLGWWWAAAEAIKARNTEMDKLIPRLVDLFGEKGFSSILLKGQGIARYYPLPECRAPGDVDLWVLGDRKDIVPIIRARNPKGRICYHHGDYGQVDGLEVEVHFKPTWMYSPFKNRRLQAFFERSSQPRTIVLDGREVAAPNKVFDGVFLLVHMFRHLFTEGIGLRQMMDYAFFLMSGLSEDEREAILSEVRALGLRKFFRAVMYVQQTVFGLEASYLPDLVDPDAGAFLLDEIMLSGNFGYYDVRQAARPRNRILRVIWKLKRNLRFFAQYPSETLWAPLWKSWHEVWRKRHSYK